MPNINDPRLRKAFWDRVAVQNDGCWQWTGTISIYGYGRISWPPSQGESQRAHRTAYLALVGQIEDGKVLDHLCRNRACVNPEHLEPVTPRENILRGHGIAATNHRKVACVNGHPFDTSNLYMTPDGRRQCRTCLKERRHAYQARKAQAVQHAA